MPLGRTKEDWPDQWPAVVDDFAAPVPGDEGEVVSLRPLLRQTQVRAMPTAQRACPRSVLRAAPLVPLTSRLVKDVN